MNITLNHRIVSCFVFSVSICLIPALISCNSPMLDRKATLSAPAWQPDLGKSSYKNAVIHADYSDPDAIRVGDTYYMTSSSFNSAPGLPLLQSKDMINWELVGHALPQ